MAHNVKIKSIKKVTHDVLQIQTEKPAELQYHPGQAVDMSINKDGWQEEKRPFTFTSLPNENYLEFTIKTYPSHNGVTNELLQLAAGDELILDEVFGDISYKGQGIFIAGGAGITPFISIFKHLQQKNEAVGNKIIFANKTKADIIHDKEFTEMLNKDFINILSDEKIEGYANGYISEDFLKQNIGDNNEYFYLCGPPPMMDAVEKQLKHIGINDDKIVKEAFS
ncbi:MAG: FAD-binding oxidoreductase [Ferruginibacter sp.]